MSTSNQNITLKGGKVTVLGSPISEGQTFPTFKLSGNDLGDVDNSILAGKVGVVAVVPSLDTPVCAIETSKFNQEVASLSDDVVVLTVSMDLPFAQARWCGAEGADKVVTASDYKYRGFGEVTGTYIQEIGLLARAVFVTDKQGTVRYVEYVSEVGDEPNYSAVTAAVKELL